MGEFPRAVCGEDPTVVNTFQSLFEISILWGRERERERERGISIFFQKNHLIVGFTPTNAHQEVKGGLSCKKPKIFLKFFSIVQNVQTLKTIFLYFFLPLFEQEKSSKTVAVLGH